MADLAIERVRRTATRCCIVATAMAATVSVRASAQAPSAQGATAARQPLPIRVSPENVRFNNYLRDLAGPPAIAGLVGSGLIDHAFRSPTAGNDGAEGLVERLASRAGQQAVQVSVRHGLAALMHHSTDYQPCECRGFGRRVEHALLETFTDRRADGSRAFSVPRVAGAYAGSFARLAWEQDRDAHDVALGTTVSFGFSALFNIARELTGVGR